MKQNVLEEILHPLDERRETMVVNPTHFVRDPVQRKIRTETQTKKYGLVFDKRVLEPGTFKSYPYGNERVELNDQDLINIDTLFYNRLVFLIPCHTKV